MRLEPVVIRSPFARGALFVLAALWAVAGWWIVVQGSLMLSLDKRSRHSVLLEDGPALVMAAIFLLLSTATAAALLQSLRAGKGWFKLLLLINVGFPIAYRLVV
ncbi:MAG TPA: hypothetical protein VK165_20480 [Azonexus sp.]|nr:hypothetical protein [Azonexus sp.]